MAVREASIEPSSAPISLDLSELPDFLAVGPPHTAITWLHRILTGRVNLPRIVKEPRFFDLRFSKGLGWYRVHFLPVVAGLPVGEVAPTYFYSVEAALENLEVDATRKDYLYAARSVSAVLGAQSAAPSLRQSRETRN